MVAESWTCTLLHGKAVPAFRNLNHDWTRPPNQKYSRLPTGAMENGVCNHFLISLMHISTSHTRDERKLFNEASGINSVKHEFQTGLVHRALDSCSIFKNKHQLPKHHQRSLVCPVFYSPAFLHRLTEDKGDRGKLNPFSICCLYSSSLAKYSLSYFGLARVDLR